MNLLSAFRMLTGALLLLLAGSGRAQNTEAPESVFAGVPQETLAGDNPNFNLFDPKFYDNQLFLLGESHGVQRPQEIDLALLKHLNQRAGVRTYVAEVDCIKAYYLNKYLRTGQDSTLQLVFRSWVAGTAQWGNRDFFHKVQQIRALNQTLPAARRIQFIGLDQLQDLPLAADFIRALVERHPVPEPLRGQLDSVVTLLHGADAGRRATVGQRANREINAHKGRYRRIIGPAYNELAMLLRNLTYQQQGLDREAILFANFEIQCRTRRLAHEKLYGLWGLAHVLQGPVQGGFLPLAARIRQSQLPGHNKVVSLLCIFSGCQMLYPTAALPAPWQTSGQPYSRTDKFNHDGPLVMLAGMPELKQRTAPGSTTLFQLNAPGAATTRQPIRLQYAPGLPPNEQLQLTQLPAAIYAQYLLLVRDSGSVEPLQPTSAPGQ